LPEKPSRKKKTTTQSRSEHVEQSEFVAWFRRTFPEVEIIAIPNGGARNPVVAVKLKLEGVRRGVPDLFVPEWDLWIEMKVEKGGRESPEQKEFRAYLTKTCGHVVYVAHGARAAIDFVTNLRGI
jgi:hypothetical protein